MSDHSPEFINSEFTVSTNDADKVATVKAALAADTHVFVFIYMDGCGHCMDAEAAWVEFTEEVNDDEHPNAEAFAISNTMMKEFGTALGDADVTGFPTFRHVHTGDATDYNGGRSSDELIAWMEDVTPLSSPSYLGTTNRTKKTTSRKYISKAGWY